MFKYEINFCSTYDDIKNMYNALKRNVYHSNIILPKSVLYSPINNLHVLNAYPAAHLVTTTCRFNYMPIFIICTQKTLGEMITFALQT